MFRAIPQRAVGSVAVPSWSGPHCWAPRTHDAHPPRPVGADRDAARRADRGGAEALADAVDGPAGVAPAGRCAPRRSARRGVRRAGRRSAAARPARRTCEADTPSRRTPAARSTCSSSGVDGATMASAVSTAPASVVARVIVANPPSRTLSVSVRAPMPWARSRPATASASRVDLAAEVGEVVEVVGERLLVADRLDLPLGLDRPVVAAVGEVDEVLAVGPPERADDGLRVERGEVADRGDAHPLQAGQRGRADAPQAPHRQRVEVGELARPARTSNTPAPGPDAVGRRPRLGVDRRQLGDELVRSRRRPSTSGRGRRGSPPRSRVGDRRPRRRAGPGPR